MNAAARDLARDPAAGELDALLATVSDEISTAVGRMLPALASYLDSEGAGAYALAATERGVDLEYYETEGDAFRGWPADFGRALRARPRGLLQYDPLCPDARQRNRVRVITAATFREVSGATAEFRALSARHPAVLAMHQVRTLVCDGPAMLAWVGAVRREPYGPREIRRLDRIVPLLRRRFALEARLSLGQAATVALGPALERLGAPAFVLGPGGRVAHANAAGRVLPAAATEAAFRRIAARGTAPGWSVTRVSAPGLPAHRLAVRSAPCADPAPRVRALAARWRLTPREAQVLAGVARGEANKEIAAVLRCAECTIEAHVTVLRGRARADTRSALAAAVWSATPGGPS